MYIEELLEVGIGLVFVWLVLALACMGIQEWLAGLLKFRAKDLETAIRGMIEEPPQKGSIFAQILNWFKRIGGGFWTWCKRTFAGIEQEDTTFVGTLYKHPLIKAFSKPGKKPSYIPAHTFALALFDMAMTAGTDASTIQAALHTLKGNIDELPEKASQAARRELDALATRAEQVTQDEQELAKLQQGLDDLVTAAQFAADHVKEVAKPQIDVHRKRLAAFRQEVSELSQMAGKIPGYQARVDSLRNEIQSLAGAAQQNTVYQRWMQALQDAVNALPAVQPSATTYEERLAGLQQGLTLFTSTYAQLKPLLEDLTQTKAFQAGVAKLEARYQGSQVKHAFDSLLMEAQTQSAKVEETLAKARTNAETWFNDTMARLTGWYKRRSQLIGAIVGIVIAVVMNVDSFAIASTLWREPQVRQALASRAEKFELPKESAEDPTEPETPSKVIDAFEEEFDGLQIPMGWVTTTVTVSTVSLMGNNWQPIDAPGEGIPMNAGYLLPKILGWVVSGLAASLGAPFWFDVLKKITNIRMAGLNPTEQEEKKKT